MEGSEQERACLNGLLWFLYSSLPGGGRVSLRVVHERVILHRAARRALGPVLIKRVRNVRWDRCGERRPRDAALVRLVTDPWVDDDGLHGKTDTPQT